MPQGPNTILLRGHHSDEYREGIVAATKTITPGDLLDQTNVAVDDYGRITVQPHAVAGGKAQKLVAVEEFFTGETVAGKGATIDDTYAAGTLVRFHECEPGDTLWMRLKQGESVTPADYLASAGGAQAGQLIKIGTANPSDTALFRAMEVKDNSGGSGPVRVRVNSL